MIPMDVLYLASDVTEYFQLDLFRLDIITDAIHRASVTILAMSSPSDLVHNA